MRKKKVDLEDGCQLEHLATLTLVNAVNALRIEVKALWARLEALEAKAEQDRPASAEDSGKDLGKQP